MFDAFSSALLISGSIIWLLVIVVEYLSACRPTKGEFPTPCFEERKFTGYNLVFIGLPVATIMVAQMRMLNSLGALGLTCIVEAGCVLGLTGYAQIVAIHPVLSCLAGIASTLICMNTSWMCGVVMGVPLLLIMALCEIVCHQLCFPEETATNMYTCTSGLYWALDAWLILARLSMLFLADPGWVDHFWFDVYSAASLVVVGVIACAIVQRMRSDKWPEGFEIFLKQ